MNRDNGRKRSISLEDGLGYLVPPGRLSPRRITEGLIQAIEQRRFLAGHGVPSVPTRFVVSMDPADRAALDPTTEDRIATELARYAESCGYLIVGDLEVEFEANPAAAPGRPLFWAGFTDDDLLVLSSPRAAVGVFVGR